MENQKEYFVPINEVAKQLDVPAHTLRYWEKQFPGAIRPVTGAGNRRYYRRDTIEKLESIKSLLYDKGMTIAGVKKILHNGTFETETSNVKPQPQKIIVQKVETKSVDNDDIDAVIDLLNQAKMFLN